VERTCHRPPLAATSAVCAAAHSHARHLPAHARPTPRPLDAPALAGSQR
jgi:hypothetical protein